MMRTLDFAVRRAAQVVVVDLETEVGVTTDAGDRVRLTGRDRHIGGEHRRDSVGSLVTRMETAYSPTGSGRYADMTP